MDCASLPDDGQKNCTNLWGVNCINQKGFDFLSLWNITQNIQRYCPTDPRLFLEDGIAATLENAALTGKACKAFAGSTWQYYPAADVWVRLATWKFPLLQLVASSPRPPLGFAVEGFVILHLLGDPIGTIKDLLRVISSCQERAEFWRTYLSLPTPGQPRLDPIRMDRAWKTFTLITISYDEWGQGAIAQAMLKSFYESLLPTEKSTTDFETFLRLCNLTAGALAADRATRFLPIIVAQCFFVGAIAVAIAKVVSNTSSTTVFINIEAHGIAFSALYFWILPAVFLASVIGVSQTQNAIPRILDRFQTGLNQEFRNKKIKFPSHKNNQKQMRIVSGGIYSWQPDPKGASEAKSLKPLLQRNVLPLVIVGGGTVTACLVSLYVPPFGWEQRLCAEAMFFLAWLLSFSLTCLIKLNTSSPSYSQTGLFWLTFVKDLLVTIATMGGVGVTLIGIFNRCDSYTLWGRAGLALPNQPDVAAILAHRISNVYPAIAFTSIGLQMFVIPITITIWYRHALLVFLQRDDHDENSLRSSTAAPIATTPVTADVGTQFEDMELQDKEAIADVLTRAIKTSD